MYDKLSNLMMKKGILKDEDDVEVFEYGMELATLKLIHTISIFLIGLFFNKLPETILFLILFSFFRSNINGYHSKSKIICLLLSMLMAIGLIILTSYLVTFNFGYTLDLLMIVLLITYLFLTWNTTRKKYAVTISIVALILFYFLKIYNFPMLLITITYCIALTDLLSILGKMGIKS